MSLTSYAAITPYDFNYHLLAQAPIDSELINVIDFSVIDGDTVDLILDKEEEPSIKARILLIDSPERNEIYFEEAKYRLNELLQQADTIQIEYEGNRKDRYQRDLVHIWVDGFLVQEIMVTEGYAIARYIHDYLPNSNYVQTIYESQDYAELNNLGVWANSPADFLAKAERPHEFIETNTEPEQMVTSSPQTGYYVDEYGNGLIKGSNNRIYHIPGSTYYEQTTNPATWFKTVQEAEQAGYRAPKR